MNIDFKLVLRAGLVVVALIAIYLTASRFLHGVFSPEDLLKLIKDSGPWAPLVYIGLFICSPGIPASGLAIASGAMFGLWWGYLYTMIGALFALIPPFWFSRLLGRKMLDKLLSKVGGSVEDKVEAFQQNVEKQGWRYIAFCRLIPLFPFSLLNLLFGLTRIRFRTYLLTSFIFAMPNLFAFVYIGYAGTQAADSGGVWLYVKVFLALGCLICLACLPQLIKFAKTRWGRK
jgi:uncharacterized membrane protein YdjX (TVP38/TMEM64 family)